jgi:HAD superfamily hydrolase (TIGR01509 family)
MFPVRLVIFDMDGLMFDTERLAVDAWRSAGEQFGFEIPPGLVIETVGLNRKDSKAVLLRRLGEGFPYDEVRGLRIRYAEEAMALSGVPVKEGLFELLDALDEAGIVKAVGTSTERTRALKLLELAGVRNRFDAIVCGDDVERGKPCPDIFLAAAAKLGCDPAGCMVLEDSESGLTAAHCAGMMPVLIPDLKAPSAEALALAFRVFRSLTEVKRFLSGEPLEA